MSEPKTLYGAEHVRRYRETGGEVGHIWKEGSTSGASSAHTDSVKIGRAHV